MAVDPNTYALSIALQLDATTAFERLDQFGETVVGIESQIADAGKKAVSQIDATISSLNVNLSGVGERLRDITTGGDQLTAILAEANIQVENAGDNYEQQIKDLKKRIDMTREVYDLTEEMRDWSKEELKRIDDYNEQFEKLVESVERKNRGHAEEFDWVTAESQVVNDTGDSLRDNGRQIGTNAGTYRQIWYTLRKIFDLLLYIDKETENFVTSNYRYYGSQQQILKGIRQMTIEQGLFYGKAMESYQLLADLRIPEEEILQYTAAVSNANRYLGVGTKTLAQFSRRMKIVGWDAQRTEDAFHKLSSAMRQYGLTSEDVRRIMEDMTLTMSEQIAYFGKDGPEALLKARTAIAGLGKIAGLTADEVAEINKLFELTGIKAIRFWEVAGGVTSTDPTKRYNAIWGAMQNIAGAAGIAWDELERGTLTTVQQQALQQAAENYEATAAQVTAVARVTAQLRKENKLALLTTEDFEKALKAIKDDAMDPLANANKEFYAQWNLLIDSGGALIKMVLVPLTEVLKYALLVVNLFIRYTTKLIEKIGEVWKELEAIPILGYLFKLIKYGAGLVVGLATAFGILILTLAGFPFVGKMIVSAIESIAKGLGRGLQTIGRAVTSVMMELLVLGLAFALVGAGAYLFAQAIVAIKDIGWAAAAYVIGLAAAVLILGVILIALAGAAQGLVVGFLILGAILLVVGVAAIMMGYGLKLAAEAFAVVIGAFIELSKINILAVGTQFSLLAMSVVIGAAALLLASAALVPAAAMFMVASVALIAGALLFDIAAGIIAKHSKALVDNATRLKTFAVMLYEASRFLAPAAYKFASSSFILTAAMVPFGIAATALWAAGKVFGWAAVGLSAGAEAFNMAVNALTERVDDFLWGSIKLIGGVIALGIAAIGLAGVDIVLGGAAIALGAVLIPLGAAAIGLRFVASSLEKRANSLLASSKKLQESGRLMMAAVVYYRKAADTIRDSVVGLRDALDLMKNAVKGIAEIGIGAETLAVGSEMLQTATKAMGAGVEQLEKLIGRWTRIIPGLDAASISIRGLAAAFMLLQPVDFNMLSQMADAGLAAVPKIDQFASQLSMSADRMDEAVNKFTKPVTRLTGTLREMQTVLADFDMQGLVLEAKVEELGAKLENYATLMESTTRRVETAVFARAVPAMQAAERAGITEVARSEAITTVQVLDQREGGEVRTFNDELLISNNDYLRRLLDIIEPWVASGSTDIKQIFDILSAYLPSMSGDQEVALGSEMNQWMR